MVEGRGGAIGRRKQRIGAGEAIFTALCQRMAAWSRPSRDESKEVSCRSN